MAPEQVLLSPALLERKEKPLNIPRHLYLKETILYINIKRLFCTQSREFLAVGLSLHVYIAHWSLLSNLCFLYGWSFGAKRSAPHTSVDMLLSDGLSHNEPHCIQDVQTRIDYVVL